MSAEGVSMVASKHAEFNALIRKHGIDYVIDYVAKKIPRIRRIKGEEIMVKWLVIDPNSASIKGRLDQNTVVKLLPITKLLAPHQGSLTIELSGIEQIDTAGMAFLLEIKEQATLLQLKVSFEGSTNSLNQLKSLYNLAQML